MESFCCVGDVAIIAFPLSLGMLSRLFGGINTIKSSSSSLVNDCGGKSENSEILSPVLTTTPVDAAHSGNPL
ncbi:hypothetical protein ACHAXS_011923 [Conticribra weissflogii]